MDAYQPGLYDTWIKKLNDNLGIYQRRTKANWASYDRKYGKGAATAMVARMTAHYDSGAAAIEYDTVHGAGSWTRDKAIVDARGAQRRKDMIHVNQFLSSFIHGTK